MKGSFKRDWGKRKSFGVDFKIIIKRILMIEVMKNIFNDERIIFLSGKELEINNGNIFNWKRWNGIIEGLIIEGIF